MTKIERKVWERGLAALYAGMFVSALALSFMSSV